jgi:hypothetical protein
MGYNLHELQLVSRLSHFIVRAPYQTVAMRKLKGPIMHLSRFPRVFLAHLPTPLERLDRLSAALGGP